jgi:hypothetical protein
METKVLTKIDANDNLVLKTKTSMHKLSESSRKRISNMDHHMGIAFHIKIYENIFDVRPSWLNMQMKMLLKL